MMQFALELEPMPLNQVDWNIDSMVEVVHEGMLFRNLKLLRDSKPGNSQWQDIMKWINTPFHGVYEPLTFATCCKVCGLSDPHEMRDQVLKTLGIN